MGIYQSENENKNLTNNQENKLNELQLSKEHNKKKYDEINPKIYFEQKYNQNKINNKNNKIKLAEGKNTKKDVKEKKKSSSIFQLLNFNLVKETEKSICKIFLNSKNIMSTGFFMKTGDSKKYLITCYHVVRLLTNEHIILELYNQKEVKLNIENLNIKSFENLDITLIEIKDIDKILKDIKYLYYDINYTLGYNIYKNGYIFTIGYSHDKLQISTGKIIKVNNSEFKHNLSIGEGSSGSPIMLLNNNLNEIRVIGIHKCGGININFGIFIGEILDKNKIKKNTYLIQFISIDQTINSFYTCQNTDNFYNIEEKLFIEHPELKNKKIYFFANGNIINRTASLTENKINNDTCILINEIENDNNQT